MDKECFINHYLKKAKTMKNEQNYEDRTDEMHCLEPPSLLTHLLVKSNIPVEVEKISKD